MWQIVRYSTGQEMTAHFDSADRVGAMIELVAHMTGIDVDDLDPVMIVGPSFPVL